MSNPNEDTQEFDVVREFPPEITCEGMVTDMPQPIDDDQDDEDH